MTTTEKLAFIEGSNVTAHEAEFIMADDLDTTVDERTMIEAEEVVNPLFLESPDDYVEPDWFTDLFDNNYIVAHVEKRDVEAVIETFLTTLAVLGVSAELNVIGKSYSVEEGLIEEA